MANHAYNYTILSLSSCKAVIAIPYETLLQGDKKTLRLYQFCVKIFIMLLNERYSLIGFKGNIYLIEEKLSMAKGTSDYFKKGLHSKLIKGHIVKDWRHLF